MRMHSLPALPLVIAFALLSSGCKQPAPDSDPVDSTAVLPAMVASVAPPFLSIAAGSRFGLALDSSGKVWAWGDNTSGQTQVPGDLRKVVQIAAGSDFGVALQDDGKVRVWGGSQACTFHEWDGAASISANGQDAFATVLSDGTVRLSGCFVDTLGLAKGLRDIRSVALGRNFLVALTRTGSLLFRTSMGADDFENPSVPSGIRGVRAITAGKSHVTALLEDGRVLSWGPNYEGENDVPDDLGKVIKLAAGHSATIALLEDGSIRTWGNTKNGEDQLPPDLKKARDIAVGQFICRFALDSAGRIHTWGNDACLEGIPR